MIWMMALAWGRPDVENALKESQNQKVLYSSHLGEGLESFDPADRFNIEQVNCMTWLQWVLARSYVERPTDLPQYLDGIRYYNAEISFGTRKHYVDRWVLLDPAPLKEIALPVCQGAQSKVIHLDLQYFKDNHHFQCDLYQPQFDTFEISYLSPLEMTACMHQLTDGFYVLFFVGNDQYLKYWGKNGEMGLVHSMILEKNPQGLWVHHASVDKGAVVKEPWQELQSRLANVAQGYRIYGLMDEWSPRSMTKIQDTACRSQ